jgi:hypothetical protein
VRVGDLGQRPAVVGVACELHCAEVPRDRVLVDDLAGDRRQREDSLELGADFVVGDLAGLVHGADRVLEGDGDRATGRVRARSRVVALQRRELRPRDRRAGQEQVVTSGAEGSVADVVRE